MTVHIRRNLPVAAALFALLLAGCAPEALARPDLGEDAVPTVTLVTTPRAATPTPGPDGPGPTVGAGAGATDPPPPDPSALPVESARETTQPTAEPSTPEPSESPEPARPAALIQPGDNGAKVRELQHRLLQIQWFEGRITPDYGDKTRLAVEGFQGKRGLPQSGYVDQATWDRLLAMTRMPTQDELHNVLVAGPALLARGDKGDQVKDVQARLRQIAWFSDDVDGSFGPRTEAAVEGFQTKREIPATGEVDQRTLDRLHAMTRKPTVDELNNIKTTPKPKTMVIDDRCLQGRVVCISKGQRKLAWVVDGDVKLTMDVRFGSELTPTRNGVFSVGWKSRDHVSKLYGSAMPYALFFSGGQAVHYSADFAARGYNGASHGCVNVRNKNAVASLFELTKVGDKVVVYKG